MGCGRGWPIFSLYDVFHPVLIPFIHPNIISLLLFPWLIGWAVLGREVNPSPGVDDPFHSCAASCSNPPRSYAGGPSNGIPSRCCNPWHTIIMVTYMILSCDRTSSFMYHHQPSNFNHTHCSLNHLTAQLREHFRQNSTG